MSKMPSRILVIRNDKLGDVMLTYPALRLLKQSLPRAHISVLVRAYTREAMCMCPWVDEVLVDPGKDAGVAGRRQLMAALHAGRFDAAITLFSTGRISLALWAAGIPYRLAPATKLAQLLYTHRLVQRRSRSEKPEWAYNLDVAARFLCDHGIDPDTSFAPPYLSFPAQDTRELRSAFCVAHGLPPDHRLVFVHPGSGGSAVNLSLQQYASLLLALNSAVPLAFVISAGPGEEETARALAKALADRPHAIYASAEGLTPFARHLAFADVFISGSTGPLHIAGALDRPTAAFYPKHRSATPLRWQTLNSPERRLAFTPPAQAANTAMESIDVKAAAVAISARFLG
jgi:ADP-heptose:LPS heptosyltransferase